MDYKLEELIDVRLLQALQDKLNVVYSFPSAIIDNEGKILTAVAWQDICTKFHRTHPQCEKECIKSDRYIYEHLNEAGSAVSYRCPHGLIDNAAPILIDGKHLGNFFVGQFFLEQPDLEFFKNQAKTYGFDETAYLEAVAKVPIWTQEKVHQYLDFISEFIKIIAGIGLNHFKEIEANRAIKASEERNRAIIQSTADWIWEIDSQGKYSYCSDRIEQVLGYRADELIGQTPFDMMPPDEAVRVRKIFQRIFETKASIVDLENWNVHKDGNLVCLLTNGIPVFDENNNVIGYRGADKDITEHKQAELEIIRAKERAEENEVRLSMAIAVSNAGTWDWDIVNNIFHWSDEFLNIFSLPKDTIAGFEAWTKVLHPDDIEAASDKIREAIANHHDLINDYRIIVPDNEIRWIRALGKTTYNSVDKPIRMTGLCMDITSQKLAEQELILAHRQTEKSEEKFRKAFMTNPESVTINDLNTGKYVLVNYGFTRMFEYAEEETLGKTSLELNIWEVSNERNQFIEILKAQGTVDNMNARFRAKSGKVIDCLVSAAIIELESLPHIIAITKDITYLKIIEKELILAKEKAEESDRLKSAFLANMSHEIRTPMNGILGFAQLLKEPNLTGDEQQQYIRIIEKSGARMLNIIHDIIDIAKIESGQMEVIITETNINAHLKFIYDFFTPEVEQKGITLVYRCALDSNEAIINTDSEKVYAILINLVKNAVKNTRSGSIELGYLKKGEYLEFFVIDTGIGIPKERQLAIFHRFVQADISNKRIHEGAGLGLSIAKAYVEMLGGKIWVESESGKGSAFYFTIPIRKKHGKVNDILDTVSIELQGSPVKKLKILLVEDDEDSRFLITKLIKNVGREFITVGTGLEAVNAIQKDPDIDLVLMDIMIPELNGYEATRQIRQFNKKVIIIAQTAYALSGDREKALEAGCNDYLTKPVKYSILMELIRKYFK